MKNWKLWIGILILVLLTGRLIYKFVNRLNSMSDEREWYSHQLHYDLSIRVDTVVMRNNAKVGIGRIFGTVTRGNTNARLEDSLSHQLKYHAKLRFNESKEEGKVVFTSPVAGDCQKGDSLTIDSDADQIIVYRNKARKRKIKFSVSLAGQMLKKK